MAKLNAFKMLVGKPAERDHLEIRDVYRRLILEWMLGKYGGKVWT
jgi:hypothetical protein